ncbi:MAG: hypothetical protein JXB00_14575 [Bacteroidales bacterium]|nr:hypothetical protein [Bacteroidales bacterium]
MNCSKYILTIFALILAVFVLPVMQKYTSGPAYTPASEKKPAYTVSQPESNNIKTQVKMMDTLMVDISKANNLTYWFISIDTYPYGTKKY